MSAPYPDCGDYDRCDDPMACRECQIDRHSWGERPDVEPAEK